MLEDIEYANRIKLHYELFKKAKKTKPNYFTNPKLNKKNDIVPNPLIYKK